MEQRSNTGNRHNTDASEEHPTTTQKRPAKAKAITKESRRSLMQNETKPDDPKTPLELKKLALEIAELERPWWKRPTYILAALPTLLAIFALTVGFINGYFSASLTKLDNQKHDLQAEIKQFEETRNTLVAQNEKLRQEVLDKETKLTNIRRIGATLRGTALSLEMRQAETGKADAEMKRIQAELEKIILDLTKVVESKNEPY
jgi:cell division protein FtsB